MFWYVSCLSSRFISSHEVISCCFAQPELTLSSSRLQPQRRLRQPRRRRQWPRRSRFSPHDTNLQICKRDRAVSSLYISLEWLTLLYPLSHPASGAGQAFEELSYGWGRTNGRKDDLVVWTWAWYILLGRIGHGFPILCAFLRAHLLLWLVSLVLRYMRERFANCLLLTNVICDCILAPSYFTIRMLG